MNEGGDVEDYVCGGGGVEAEGGRGGIELSVSALRWDYRFNARYLRMLSMSALPSYLPLSYSPHNPSARATIPSISDHAAILRPLSIVWALPSFSLPPYLTTHLPFTILPNLLPVSRSTASDLLPCPSLQEQRERERL